MQAALTVAERDWERLIRALADPRREHMAFASAGVSDSPGRRSFLLRRLLFPADDEYEVREAYAVRITPTGAARVLEHVRDAAAILDFHNHVAPDPSFSAVDDGAAPVRFRQFQDFAPGAMLAQFVFGPDGSFDARWTAPTVYPEWRPLDEVRVVGPGGIRRLHRWPLRGRASRRVDGTGPWIRERHARTLPFMKESLLRDAADLTVGVVGVGGTGALLLALARGFFRSFVLVDPDTVEPSNLARLAGATLADADAQAPKVEVARRELLRYDPGMQVEALASRFPDAEAVAALKECDVVVACPDDDATRYTLAEFCARHLVPLIETGSGMQVADGGIVAAGCQVRLQLPAGPCLACLGLPLTGVEGPVAAAAPAPAGYVRGTDRTPMQVVTLNAAAATFAMRTLLAFVGGTYPPPLHLFYDERAPSLLNVPGVSPVPECPLCGDGDAGIAGCGDRLPSALALPVPARQCAREDR